MALISKTVKERVVAIINPSIKKELIVDELIQIQTEALIGLLNGLPVPEQLNFVLVETVIARYNRLGAEGYESENIDIISRTYTDDLFTPYTQQINKYLATKKEYKKPFRLI